MPECACHSYHARVHQHVLGQRASQLPGVALLCRALFSAVGVGGLAAAAGRANYGCVLVPSTSCLHQIPGLAPRHREGIGRIMRAKLAQPQQLLRRHTAIAARPVVQPGPARQCARKEINGWHAGIQTHGRRGHPPQLCPPQQSVGCVFVGMRRCTAPCWPNRQLRTRLRRLRKFRAALLFTWLVGIDTMVLRDV